MDKNLLKKIVTFCILMEGNGGILNKSPYYILEKYSILDLEFNSDLDDENIDMILKSYLDSFNCRKYDSYMDFWKIKDK